MEIRHADLQIEVEDAEDGGVLLTIIDSARLSLSLPRRTARELLDDHRFGGRVEDGGRPAAVRNARRNRWGVLDVRRGA